MDAEAVRLGFQKVGSVSGLYLYPVKSCAWIPLQTAECTRWGLRHQGVTDRHWMVTRADYSFITQRQYSKLALIDVSVTEDDMQLTAPGMPRLRVEKVTKEDPSKVVMVRVWDSKPTAQDCGDEASLWFSTYLQAEGLRLVVSTPSTPKRKIGMLDRPTGYHGNDTDESAFPDYASYHLFSEESVKFLNNKLQTQVTKRNFRPNITVEGPAAFSEDQWSEVRIGPVNMRVIDSSDRCVVTTVNPGTGERSREQQPLQTLRSFRIAEGYANAPLFGIYLQPDTLGSISVGTPVYALTKK